MLRLASNFIEEFDSEHPTVELVCAGCDCCQKIRKYKDRGWFVYVPTKWLELIETSQDDMILYINFINSYISKIGCNINYLGKELCSIVPCANCSGTSGTLTSECHVFYLTSDAPRDQYSWKIYMSFILLRDLYIYYGWPYSKAIIHLLKTKYEGSEEKIIGLGYILGHFDPKYKLLKQKALYTTNLGNQLFTPTVYLKKDWIKRLSTSESDTKNGLYRLISDYGNDLNVNKVSEMIDTKNYNKLVKYIFK